MNFASSTVLYLIPIVIPLIVWFLWWSWRKRQFLVRQFVSERLLPQLLEGASPSRQKLKLVLLAASILFILLALARPQWGFVWEETTQRGRDILVAIDTSKSMLAADMAPNRLQRAKLAALDLQRLAKYDRLGLIAFAGGAFLQSPLTLDDEAFRQNIESLDTSIIPQGGTSLAEAIENAVSAFASEEGDNHRVLVIFTDGEDQDQGALAAAEKAAEKNMKIFTVGVGTPAGELIRVTEPNGQTSFIKDSSGNAVKSRLNEDLLRQIATTGNGFYLALREGNAMQTLYQKGLEPMPTTEISSKLVRHLNEQFHWPLGIAIALLIVEILLPPAAKKRLRPQVAMILLFLVVPSIDASPSRAYKDYKAGHYKDALNEYEELLSKKPNDPVLSYNAGASAYKAKKLETAVKHFNNAVTAPDLGLQQSAYYNLGNAQYKLGEDESKPEDKIKLWENSLKNYQSAVKLNEQDKDAVFNRDFVQKRLEELKKQQQQQNKDQNKDDNKDKQDNQDNKQQDKKENQDQKKDQQNKDNKKEDQQQQDKQDQKNNEQQKSEQQKKDEEKKKQEEQQQQQQGQEGDDKKDSKEKGGQPQAKNDERDPQKEAEQEARAAQLGQMTPKQAQQMLDAQKSDERALIYRPPSERKRASGKTLNDW